MKSILLVEDDPFLIDIYLTKFQEAGFAVETAYDGEGGLRRLKEKKPDILVLDIVLPNVDGWELIREIKAMKGYEDLPIIILSNLGQKQEVGKGLNLGASRYLIKAHYTPSQVVEEVKRLLKNPTEHQTPEAEN